MLEGCLEVRGIAHIRGCGVLGVRVISCIGGSGGKGLAGPGRAVDAFLMGFSEFMGFFRVSVGFV